MIIFFYALILLTIIGLLGFALYSEAPTIAASALAVWEWWRALPVERVVIAPLGNLAGEPGLAGSLAGMWNPWGAAGALALCVVLFGLALRYLPRYISGDL